MPIIVAICPYCRAGGVRARDTAIGASATCPKCNSNFTIVPSEVPTNRGAQPAPSPPAGAPVFGPLGRNAGDRGTARRH